MNRREEEDEQRRRAAVTGHMIIGERISQRTKVDLQKSNTHSIASFKMQNALTHQE